MKNELISIIVPMYNSQNTIQKCVDSILNQTYTDIEVILVNDGSIDRTLEICKNYKEKDSRIKIISQSNMGLISARIAGINSSAADYVGFVDSDDWIEPTMFEELFECMAKYECDVVSSGIYRDYVEDNYTQEVYDDFPEGEYRDLESSIYKTMLWDDKKKDFGVHCELVNKLFKKKLIKKIYDKIDTRVFYGEDCLTFFSYMMLAKSIYILKKSFYHYIIHSDSMCRKADEGLLLNTYYLYKGLDNAFDGYGEVSYLLRRQLRRYILEIEAHSLRQMYNVSIDSLGVWKFDYPEVKKKQVVIYAAGGCSVALSKYLVEDMGCSIVAWLDKKPQDKEKMCLHEIRPAKDIEELNFDYLVIGVEHELLAKSIKKELEQIYDVPEDKILWKHADHNSIFDSL